MGKFEWLFMRSITVLDRKDCTLHRAIEVKLPWLRAVPAGQEWILPQEKWAHFFLGPWLLVCQFIAISNQMESTGEVSNVEQKNLYNGLLHKKILLMFDTSPVVSIWLKMSINWHTKSQGPKKKCTILHERGSTPALPTLLVISVVLLHTEKVCSIL